jgi:hypothetical protein
MSNEIQASFQPGKTLYALVRSASSGMIWQGSLSGFVNYATAGYSGYPVPMVEQGTASAYYVANFPTFIPPGAYNVVAKQQLGANPVEGDSVVDVGDVQWNGVGVTALSDLGMSGQLSQFFPERLAYGVMVQNFPIYLRSSADHSTGFTSGIVSGQIARDAGGFGPLQQGIFTERGNGCYYLAALTSGDMAGNTIQLLFTAVGVSGGAADTLPLSIITQRTSGH